MTGIFRWSALGAATTCLLALASATASAAESAPGTIRVSISGDGGQGNGVSRSFSNAVSGDGRFVAFASFASNLVAGDTNNTWDVFVRDLQTSVTKRVSIASTGSQASAISDQPALSRDGRSVVFYSLAYDLIDDDTNNNYDVFVHDLDTAETSRVSVASNGAEGNGASFFNAISGDGRVVAFRSLASNLVAGDTNKTWDIFVRDRETGETTRANVASDGTQANAVSFVPSISGDGRYVAFASLASNLVDNDTNGSLDVFVRDRDTGETTRVSVASDGAQGNFDSDGAAISADGRFVAFSSEASNLVAGDTNAASDVFVHDRDTGETTRVSVASDGAGGNSNSFSPAISDDGRYVAFASFAANLVDGDTNSVADIFIHDRQTGETTRVSIGNAGAQGDMSSVDAAISGDGRFVSFHSSASNLVDADTNELGDVFLRDRGVPPPPPAYVVVFPSFTSGRLYNHLRPGGLQVWPPSNTLLNKKLCLLRPVFDAVDGAWEPGNRHLFTKSADDGGLVQQTAGGDVYQAFIDYLDALNAEQTILGFEIIPYDWRWSVEDVAQRPLAGGTNTLAEHIQALAGQYGPLTLIGHGHGGLLAKALVMALQAEVGGDGLSQLVNRLILVATPQLGTPKSIAALLHGQFPDDVSKMPRAPRREAIETMPGGYSALPSAGYFTALPTMPAVRFEPPPQDLPLDESAQLLQTFADVYGGGIASFASFSEFLAGVRDGRPEAVANAEYPRDLKSCISLPKDKFINLSVPNKAVSPLIDAAAAAHERMDAWTPPEGLAVVQIAGVGKGAPSAITYTSRKCTASDQFCRADTRIMTFSYDWSMDGDGAVVQPSALAMPAPGAVSYCIQMSELEQDHRTILNAPPTQQALAAILTGQDVAAPCSPDAAVGDLTIARLVAGPEENYVAMLVATDEQGRQMRLAAGKGGESLNAPPPIPGSTFKPVAGVQTLVLIGGRPYSLEVTGQRSGSVDLEFAVQRDGEVVGRWAFRDVALTPDARAQVLLNADGMVSALRLDSDGDGAVDAFVAPVAF